MFIFISTNKWRKLEEKGEKERLMREIARKWRGLQREVREVQRDVGRLRGK